MSDDTDFKFLLEKIHRNKGVDFSLYRPNTLKRRIASRLKSVGSTNYSDYIIYLNKEPEEYNKLIEAVTINVTEFFRNPETFSVIEKKVIPEIIRIKESEGRKVIRAWSAGTSYGEEAYSLAILFIEALKEKISDFDIKVYGTDIDPACLKKARMGTYGPNSLKEIKKDLTNRYFDKKGENYEIREAIKRLTRFEPHNLVSDKFMPHSCLI